MRQSFFEAVSAVRQGKDARGPHAGFIVAAECTPPRSANADGIKACVSSLADMVDAISVPECADGVRMSAIAACGHVIAAGAEPILHLLTRDMNRIALQAGVLGAVSMGVKSILCTAGRHHALTTSRSARGVFDVDPIQMVSIADGIRKRGELADGQQIDSYDGPSDGPNDGPGVNSRTIETNEQIEPIDSQIDFLIGVDTNPFCEPVELQVMTLEKAAAAGADFVITQPVFRLEKFGEWMNLVRERKLHERMCIIASVMPLASAEQAKRLASHYSHLDITEDLIESLGSTSGVQIACDTAKALKDIDGVRGICVTTELAKDVLSASGIAGS